MNWYEWLLSLFQKQAVVYKGDPLGPQTIGLSWYLAKFDNNLSRFQQIGDALQPYRRIDHGGFQVTDSYMVDGDTFITTWSYPPFQNYVAVNGDGGERYVIRPDKRTVAIDYTRDGGKPEDQHFTEDGWIVFRDDATEDWKVVIANLNGKQSYTRYCLQDIVLPWLRTQRCIVSEHYNAPTLERASSMERIFLASGIGRVCWQAWNKSAIRPLEDFRAPDFGWNNLDGWVLTDTRVSTIHYENAFPLTGNDMWYPNG